MNELYYPAKISQKLRFWTEIHEFDHQIKHINDDQFHQFARDIFQLIFYFYPDR